MQQFVTVSTEGSGAVPALALRAAEGRVLVRYASGVVRVVTDAQIAPANQAEVLEYIASVEGYQTRWNEGWRK